eukprot:Rmarinus@m.29355
MSYLELTRPNAPLKKIICSACGSGFDVVDDYCFKCRPVFKKLGARHIVQRRAMGIEGDSRPQTSSEIVKAGGTEAKKLTSLYHEFFVKDSNDNSYRHIVKVNRLIAFLGTIGIGFAVLSYEKEYGDGYSDRVFLYDFFGTIVTFALVLLVCYSWKLRYNSDNHFQTRILGRAPGSHTFFESLHLRYMLVEVLLVFPHVPPGVQYNFTVEAMGVTSTYSIQGVVSVLQLLRLFFWIRVFVDSTEFNNNSFRFVGEMGGVKVGPRFALRAFVMSRPFTMLLMLAVINMFVLAHALRVSERPYSSTEITTVKGRKEDQFDNLWNSIWMVVVTMTTVGYGDITPGTHPGRFFAMLACFSNLLLSAMTVVTITTTSTFSASERLVFDSGTKLLVLTKAKEIATVLVQRVWRERCYRREHGCDSLRLAMKRYDSLRSWRQLRNKIRELDSTASTKVLSDTLFLSNAIHSLRLQLSEVRDFAADILEFDGGPLVSSTAKCAKMPALEPSETISNAGDSQRIWDKLAGVIEPLGPRPATGLSSILRPSSSDLGRRPLSASGPKKQLVWGANENATVELIEPGSTRRSSQASLPSIISINGEELSQGMLEETASGRTKGWRNTTALADPVNPAHEGRVAAHSGVGNGGIGHDGVMGVSDSDSGGVSECSVVQAIAKGNEDEGQEVDSDEEAVSRVRELKAKAVLAFMNAGLLADAAVGKQVMAVTVRNIIPKAHNFSETKDFYPKLKMLGCNKSGKAVIRGGMRQLHQKFAVMAGQQLGQKLGRVVNRLEDAIIPLIGEVEKEDGEESKGEGGRGIEAQAQAVSSHL